MKSCFLFFFYVFILQSHAFAESRELNVGTGTGTSIVETAGHNFILTANDLGQISVMKIDSTGNQFWLKKFGLTTGMNPDNKAFQIIRITDDKFLITGKYDPGIGAYNMAYAIMIDSSGNTIWENTYGNSNTIGRNTYYDSLHNVIYLTGNSQITTSDIYVLKIGIAGNLISEFFIDLGGSDVGENIFSVSPNEIIITGNTNALSSGTHDGFILNLDSTGHSTWLKYYGGPLYENFSDLHRNPDGSFLILGTTSSFGSGLSDAWLVKLNSVGDTIWTRTIGSVNTEIAYHFYFENENSIWICGKSIEDTINDAQGWIAQIDSMGNLMTAKLYGGSRNEIFYSIITSQNSVFAIGESITGVNDVLVYLVRQDSISQLSNINYPVIVEKPLAFPNPTTEFTNIFFQEEINLNTGTIFLTDVIGHLIPAKLDIGDKYIKIYMPQSSGIYFLKIYTKYKSFSISLIKN